MSFSLSEERRRNSYIMESQLTKLNKLGEGKMNDKQILYQAVCVWKNYIETGDPTLCKQDLLNMSGDKDIQRIISNLPKLNIEQQYFINKLENMKKDILESKFTKSL